MLTWLLVALKALLVEVDVPFPGFLPAVHPKFFPPVTFGSKVQAAFRPLEIEP